MFFDLISGLKTNNEDSLPTHEQAECVKKHENSRLIPQTSNGLPCDLLIVIAKANRMGN